ITAATWPELIFWGTRSGAILESKADKVGTGSAYSDRDRDRPQRIDTHEPCDERAPDRDKNDQGPRKTWHIGLWHQCALLVGRRWARSICQSLTREVSDSRADAISFTSGQWSPKRTRW